jgi:SAM-dependent methyltransferase
MTNINNNNGRHTIVPKARAKIHEVIIDYLAKQPGGKLLDAPAGYGHLSMHLKEQGYEVVSGEIEPEIFKVEDIDCIYINLNRHIEAPDEEFDYVCCVDGLEHMTDPYRAVEEFSRVLKTGGVGIFSVPNYSNIENRFKYFIRGYLEKPKSIEDYKAAGSNLFNFHNSPLNITLLELMFAINDLKLIEILRDEIKKKQRLFFPIVLIMKFAALLSSDSLRRKNRYDLTLKDEVILGGNTMILVVRKSGKSA